MYYNIIKISEKQKKLLIDYCNKILELIDTNYPNQKNYVGTINKFSENIISILNFAYGKNMDLKKINFFSLARSFVDDTTDIQSDILVELAKIEKILERME